jgi:hypothetical protein
MRRPKPPEDAPTIDRSLIDGSLKAKRRRRHSCPPVRGGDYSPASVPRYRLIDEQGEDLGPFQASTLTWTAGDRIPRGPGRSLIVVNLTPALDGDDVDGYLVVKTVE